LKQKHRDVEQQAAVSVCEDLPGVNHGENGKVREADDSIQPGVERSETPGLKLQVTIKHIVDGGFLGLAALHPRAGSPVEHLGGGARLYAAGRFEGWSFYLTGRTSKLVMG
jgi:hypothetical protein